MPRQASSVYAARTRYFGIAPPVVQRIPGRADSTMPPRARRAVEARRRKVPMLVISGPVAIVHSEPDGDSVHFTANDPSEWDLLRGTPVQRNAGGVAQLRLDAIDALETHYTARGGGGRLHQPLELGHAAAARLVELLGF